MQVGPQNFPCIPHPLSNELCPMSEEHKSNMENITDTRVEGAGLSYPYLHFYHAFWDKLSAVVLKEGVFLSIGMM